MQIKQRQLIDQGPRGRERRTQQPRFQKDDSPLTPTEPAVIVSPCGAMKGCLGVWCGIGVNPDPNGATAGV